MRKLILSAALFVQVLYLFLFCFKDGYAALGDTSVCKWKGNKTGAFTLMFDDSMYSQVDTAIPHMIARGLTGSFYVWVNGHYQDNKSYWDGTAQQNGMELANHTMNHPGGMTDSTVEDEIGGAAEYLWNIWPASETKLGTYSVPGSWGEHPGVTSAKKDYLSAKYFIPREMFDNDLRGCPKTYAGDDRVVTNSSQIIGFAQEAVTNGTWIGVYFHGVGGEWVTVTTAIFDALLDHLVTVKNTTLWVATTKKIYMYWKERDTFAYAKTNVTSSNVTISVTSDQHPSNMTGNLYNEPLTLRTEVPSSWASCRVTQGADSKVYSVSSNIVQYDALPNSSDIVLVESGSGTDTTPPGAPAAVRDGTGTDISSTQSAVQLSANWDAATDPDGPITAYLYAIGTTAGGTNLLGWQTLGNVLSVTKTGLTLTAGATYYFSVKAQSAGGTSTARNSNGQYVQAIVTGDTTPPGAPAAVRDGTGVDIDSINSTNPMNPITQLSANWDAATDQQGPITQYQYAIGTAQGATNITSGWLSNGTNLTVTKTGLTLTVGQAYYFSVRAVSAGGTGTAANSNGQTVTGTGPTTPSDIYPNPYSLSIPGGMKFSVSGQAEGTLNIYTMSGKLVRTLTGTSTINWDGTNADGEKATRGVYIYTISEADGNKKTGKFAVK